MKIKDKLLAFFFPPKCIFCRKVLEQDGICSECEKKLPKRKDAKVREKAPFVDEMYAPLYYEGYVRSAVLRYKFGGVKCSATEFAKIIRPCIEENLTGKYDCITWVPTSKSRSRKRGYDQAKLLAEELGKMLEMPVNALLKKRLDSKPQSKLSTREQRIANIIGAFKLRNVDVQDAKILIVDDISTTGSTVSECARVLKTAGAAKVYAVTLAKKRF